MTGAVVEIMPLNPSVARPDSPTGSIMTEHSISFEKTSEKNKPDWLLTIKLPSQIAPIEFGVQSEEEAQSWRTAIE